MLSGGETTVTLGARPGRPRRAQHRVPAVPRGGARRRAGHLGHRRRHRRASTAWTTSPAPSSRPTRWRARARQDLDPRAMLAGHDSHTLFDSHRRRDPHRPDADQRQRCPRHPDRLRGTPMATRPKTAPPPAHQDHRHAWPGQLLAEVLTRLFQAGADVFRLNFSHGTHEDHAARFAMIRQLEERFDRPIGILADVQGPKLRVGTLLRRARVPADRPAVPARSQPDAGRVPRASTCRIRRSSRRPRSAARCCWTTASCACAWRASAATRWRPRWSSAARCPTARASTCPTSCCRSRR